MYNQLKYEVFKTLASCRVMASLLWIRFWCYAWSCHFLLSLVGLMQYNGSTLWLTLKHQECKQKSIFHYSHCIKVFCVDQFLWFLQQQKKSWLSLVLSLCVHVHVRARACVCLLPRQVSILTAGVISMLFNTIVFRCDKSMIWHKMEWLNWQVLQLYTLKLQSGLNVGHCQHC